MKQTLRKGHIVKSVPALLLILLLLTVYGLAALAETETQDIDALEIGAYCRATTFTGELPQALEQALASGGFAGYGCYSGAMLQHWATAADRKAAKGFESGLALVAMEKDGQRVLVGLVGDEAGWGLVNLGAKALLPGRAFAIAVSDVVWNGRRRLPTRFSITYPAEGGGSETYGLWNEVNASSYALWKVVSYESVDAQGQGFALVNDFHNGFAVWSLSDDMNYITDFYPAYLPLTLEHMAGIADYPTSIDGAKDLAEASWARFEGENLAITGGVNLREKPTTTSSRIIGFLKPGGALVRVLGQEEGNDDAPWYHVRLGREEGWIYSVYTKFPGTYEFCRDLAPLPVARAAEDCILRASPADNGVCVAVLPENTLVHVMADVAGGWLYVMLPRDEIGWEMDLDGTSGYVRLEKVEQGASASAVSQHGAPGSRPILVEGAKALSLEDSITTIKIAVKEYREAHMAKINDVLTRIPRGGWRR